MAKSELFTESLSGYVASSAKGNHSCITMKGEEQLGMLMQGRISDL